MKNLNLRPKNKGGYENVRTGVSKPGYNVFHGI